MTTVMIVDDSALVRKVLSELIERAPDLTVVGTAPDPYIAREKIKALNPDVLTLDIEMPKMDGIDFLEKIMRLRPMPVVMVSSLTVDGNDTTLRALELGAVDFITKPAVDVAEGLEAYIEILHDKIRAASLSRVSRRSRSSSTQPPPPKAVRRHAISSEKLVLVGASTGGTEAIRSFLSGLPQDAPAVLITQHMPGGFTQSFAERLNRELDLTVQEGQDGTRVRPGNVYIAPGTHHMCVTRHGADYLIRLDDGPPVNRHKPSVDVLFNSAAQAAGANAVGVIMTGMGNDGASGMRTLHETGAATFAQDEASCVVFGMPQEAINAGGVEVVLPIASLAEAVIRASERSGRATRL